MKNFEFKLVMLIMLTEFYAFNFLLSLIKMKPPGCFSLHFCASTSGWTEPAVTARHAHMHTTSKKFENGVFTLKAKQMFSVKFKSSVFVTD